MKILWTELLKIKRSIYIYIYICTVIGPKVVGPLVEALILASRWAQSTMLRRLGPILDNLRGTVMSRTRPGEYLGNALGSIAVEQHTASIVSPKSWNLCLQSGT